MGVMSRSVPEEVRSYKEKMFFGLTVRQLVCAAAMLALAVPTGLWGRNFLSQDMVGWLILIEVVPFAAIGWLNYNDMPIEVIGKKAIAYYFGIQKRKFTYVSDNAEIHIRLQKIALAEETVLRRNELKAEAERKKEEKKAEREQRKKDKKSSVQKTKTEKIKSRKSKKKEDENK